jgi:hypothetical protein
MLGAFQGMRATDMTRSSIQHPVPRAGAGAVSPHAIGHRSGRRIRSQSPAANGIFVAVVDTARP